MYLQFYNNVNTAFIYTTNDLSILPEGRIIWKIIKFHFYVRHKDLTAALFMSLELAL